MSLNNLDNVKLLRFPSHGDPENKLGSLLAIEPQNGCPFPIARVFFTYGMQPNILRGDHAHIECEQLLVAVNGKIEVICTDGVQEATFALTTPNEALFIPNHIWASEKYLTEGAILMVLAGRPYESHDYIRDYNDFLKFRAQPQPAKPQAPRNDGVFA